MSEQLTEWSCTTIGMELDTCLTTQYSLVLLEHLGVGCSGRSISFHCYILIRKYYQYRKYCLELVMQDFVNFITRHQLWNGPGSGSMATNRSHILMPWSGGMDIFHSLGKTHIISFFFSGRTTKVVGTTKQKTTFFL